MAELLKIQAYFCTVNCEDQHLAFHDIVQVLVCIHDTCSIPELATRALSQLYYSLLEDNRFSLEGDEYEIYCETPLQSLVWNHSKDIQPWHGVVFRKHNLDTLPLFTYNWLSLIPFGLWILPNNQDDPTLLKKFFYYFQEVVMAKKVQA